MLVEEAFNSLHPESLGYTFSLKYSAKFNPYNANVRLKGNKIEFNLSKKWKTVSKEIQMGLVQSLLVKILKSKVRLKNTTNIDLYNIFIKKVHISVPKTKSDPVLSQSFDRVNERYFYGVIEKPNLGWHSSANKLGSYEYGSDTISISRMLQGRETELLDYIIYHEMLHKKQKFESRGLRNYHHTPEFRRKEKEFENQKEIENKIKMLSRPRLAIPGFFLKQ